jgi:peptidoglycan hydrolase FlgJ
MPPTVEQIKKKLGPAADAKIDYVVKQAPNAVVAGEKLKVNPSFILSQTAWESGWGKSKLAQSGNLAGIKAKGEEPGVMQASDEGYGKNRRTEVSKFRTYPSSENFFQEYANFISQSPRYKKVMGSKTVDDFVSGLHSGGYFTENPKTYKDNVRRINKDVQYILENLPVLDPRFVESSFAGAKE